MNNKKYLCFTAEENNTEISSHLIPLIDFSNEDDDGEETLKKAEVFSIKNEYKIFYSKDQNHWNEFIPNNTKITLNIGDNLYIKGDINNNCFALNFIINKKTYISGSIMSLINNKKITSNCFNSLFYNCKITSAPELPAVTLAEDCYVNMFSGCTELKTAPQLPAKNLADGCYRAMFEGCTALKYAPKLPATTLTWGCYDSMFEGCTALKFAPELPAIKLTNFCYRNMFKKTKIIKIPTLPATTLAYGCYDGMFENIKEE